jgi:DNA-damage-inducible protein D
MADDNLNTLVMFEGKQFRRAWLDGVCYYCIVDIIEIVTDSPQARVYWSQLKGRLKSEGFAATKENIIRIKLPSFKDGKLYEMECCTRSNVLRILLSVPSPKVEPFRAWLVQLAEEAIEGAKEPAAVERLRAKYRALGRSERWIQTRIDADAARNGLTVLWQEGGIKLESQYGRLSGNLHFQTFGVTVDLHREVKHLPARANLRDHETDLELAIGTVSEITATMLGEQRASKSFDDFWRDTNDAGRVGRAARLAAEQELGQPVVSPQNFLEEERAAKKKPLLPEGMQQPSLFDGQNEPAQE